MKFILFSLWVSFAFSHSANQTCKGNDIAEKQAVQMAEEFIRVNGYTKYPADTGKMSYEFLYDGEESRKSVLKKRHNSLQPKAFCISKSKSKWSVGFLFATIDLSKLDPVQRNGDLGGKSVTMNLDGSEIKMAHKEPAFSKWRKL